MATLHESGRRLLSRVTPVPTKTSGTDHPLPQRTGAPGQTHTGAPTGYLCQPCCQHPREETQEPLRRRDPHAEELKTVHRVTERRCTLFEEFAGTLQR